MRVSSPVATIISRVVIDADIDMDSHKLTSLSEGSGDGHSVRREQVIDVFLPLAGGTMTGDLNLAAKKLKGTYFTLKSDLTYKLLLRNAEDNAYSSMRLAILYWDTHLSGQASVGHITAKDEAGAYVKLLARGASALEEIARLQGAAAGAYFQMTKPMVISPTARPATPVSGHILINSATGAFEIYDGTHFKQEVHSLHKTVNYDDGSPLTLAPIPAGAVVLGCYINITTPFVGTTPTLDIGDTDDADGFATDNAVACTVAGWKDGRLASADYAKYLQEPAANYCNFFKFYPAAKNAIATIGGTGLSAGVAEVYFLYITLS